MTRKHISFIFDQRDMLLSLHIGFNFVRAAVSCAILERTSDFEPSFQTIPPRNSLGSEPGEAPQNRYSTTESCVESIFNLSKICTMSLYSSKKHLTCMACSIMGHHAEIKYQCKSSLPPFSTCMTML